MQAAGEFHSSAFCELLPWQQVYIRDAISREVNGVGSVTDGTLDPLIGLKAEVRDTRVLFVWQKSVCIKHFFEASCHKCLPCGSKQFSLGVNAKEM